MLAHEFSLPTRISGLVEKTWAKCKHYKGSSLNFEVGQLPSSSDLETARGTLSNIFHSSTSKDLRFLARQVQFVLDEISFGLIVPDLKLRDRLLHYAEFFLQTSQPMRDGTDKFPHHRKQLFDSPKREDTCQAHLEHASCNLRACFTHIETPGKSAKEDIALLLNLALSCIKQADKEFPLFNMDGW